MTMNFGKRILIAVPHADDEIVACSAAIGRARVAGSEIFAYYVTHGCIARSMRWPWDRNRHDACVARRRGEAEEAAKFLGITPVGWAVRPARHLWRELPRVYGEVETAAAQNGIDQIWVPAYEGGNADHDGLNAVGSVLARRMSVLEFAEYNFSGGKANSQSFPFPLGTEETLELTAEESAHKIAALKIYASEKGNLNYVKAERECWRPIAAYDYSQLPHDGRLWYTRFQWVPFRHPRVDFTDPRNVSAAIGRFLKMQE